MGLTYVTTKLRPMANGSAGYEAQFLVDTGASDCRVAGGELRKIGVQPVGKMSYELADGSVREYEFGLAVIEFMGEITATRVILGPENCEPILGVIALESVGIMVDPKSRTLKRLPALPLK